MKLLLNEELSWKRYLQWLLLPLVTIIAASSLFATPVFAISVYQMPNIKPGDHVWVLDQAEVISRLNEAKISSAFENLAKETGNEVRIVTAHRLDYGETPETFTKALFEIWFPTTEAQKNQTISAQKTQPITQTILMIDTVTNGTAVISNAKSVLTDKIANSIVSDTIMASLRDGNKYNQAFLDASDRIVAVLSGKPDPGPPRIIDHVQVEGTFKKAQETDKGNATAWVIGLLIAATIIPMATYYIYLVFQKPSSNG